MPPDEAHEEAEKDVAQEEVRKPTFAAFIAVVMDVFLDIMGFSIIGPLLPFWIIELGVKIPINTGLLVGIANAAFAGGQLVGAIVLGGLSDKHGRRPVLVIAIFFQAFSYLLVALSKAYWVLVIGLFLAGLFGGSLVIGMSWVADTSSESVRLKYMSFIGAAMSAGFILGPASGALVAESGFSVAAFIAAGLGLLNFFVAFFFLQESNPRIIKEREKAKEDIEMTDTRKSVEADEVEEEVRAGMNLKLVYHALTKDANYRLAVMSYLFVNTGFAMMESTYGLLGIAFFNMNGQQLGLIFALIGVVMVAMQALVLPLLVGRVSEKRMALAAQLLIAATISILPLCSIYLWLFILITGVMAVGYGFFDPPMASILSLLAPETIRGFALGIGIGSASLARTIGPLIGGPLFDVWPSLPFFSATGLVVVSTFLLVSIKMPAKS